MRFSWTLKELHALRVALTDAQFFQSDLQERLEENGEDTTDRFRKSKALQRNHEILGQKVLAEVVRRESESRHRRKAGHR
jgi:hypothetical protein